MATYDDVIEGLKILREHDDRSHGVYAGHDVICAGPSPGLDETAEEAVGEEDAERLEELGWHVDSETDSWACFV